MQERVRKVVVVGLGALGAPYARQIALCGQGVEVEALVPSASLSSYASDPVSINGEPLRIRLSDRCDPSFIADIVIVAVKRKDLESAIASLTPCVGESTQVVSLLNGIDSEAALAGRFGWNRVLYAKCSGVDANRIGHSVTLNSIGKLLLGEADNNSISPRVQRIRDFFASVGIPVEVPKDMIRTLWWKLMVNVGMNQVSAVKNLTYGQFREDPEAMALMRAAQREVIAVARRCGVELAEPDLDVWERQLATLSYSGRSSMLQDVMAGRSTEVDQFGGTIVALGRRYGIPTPVNDELVASIKALSL